MLTPFRRLANHRPAPAGNRTHGAALILVLAALALISFLALAIMTFIRSEDRGSRASADLVEVRMLTEMPEKLVISQIRRATRKLGTDYTWTSQPGMIRVFGRDTGGGNARPNPEEMYKLYSSMRMVLPGATNPVTDATTEVANWAANPAMFTDLNEPVRLSPTQKGTTQPSLIYPIADPRALGLVDGFNTEPPPGATTVHPFPMPVAWLYVLRDGSVVAPSSGNGLTANVTGATVDNPVVGRIAFWTDDESCKLNINTATEPAPYQPPSANTLGDQANAATIPAKGEYYRQSGHPAFTSLAPVLRNLGNNNTNTATPLDRESQDTRNDTNWWRRLTAWHDLMPRSFTDESKDSGSRGGTAAADDEVTIKQGRLFTSVDEMFFRPGVEGTEGRTAFGAPTDGPELSQDDLAKVRFFLTPHSRAPELNPYNRPKISLWPVQADETKRNELDKAFVLASTLGKPDPQLSDNPFNAFYLQRETDWQSESQPGSLQSQSDDSKIGNRNDRLMRYLQDLTDIAVPGFGAPGDAYTNFRDKYGVRSRNQILTAMFDMVRWGVNSATPPSQQATTTKLTPSYRALPPALGEQSTDYGQAGGTAVPLQVEQDSNEGEWTSSAQTTQATSGNGRFPTVSEVALVFIATKPAPPNLNQPPPPGGFLPGAGGIQMFFAIEPFHVSPGLPPASPAVRYELDFGSTANLPTLGIAVPNGPAVGVQSLQFTATAIGNPRNGQSTLLVNRVACETSFKFALSKPPNTLVSFGGDHSAMTGFASQFLFPDSSRNFVPSIKSIGPGDSVSGTVPDTNNETLNFSWVSDELNFNPAIPAKDPSTGADTQLAFAGPNNGPWNVTLRIWDGTSMAGNQQLIQEIELEFPAVTIPLPQIALADASQIPNPALSAAQNQTNRFNARFDPQAAEVAGGPPRMSMLIRPGDVVRSIEVRGDDLVMPGGGTTYATRTRGDMRLLASRIWAPLAPDVNPKLSVAPAKVTHFFSPTIDYFNTSKRQAHTLRDGAYMMEKASQPGNYSAVPGAPAPVNTAAQALAGTLVARKTSLTAPAVELPLSPAPTIQPLSVPAAAPGMKGAWNMDDRPGDFDTGPGIIEDGPYINMPDMSNGLNQVNTPNSTTNAFYRGGYFAREDGVTFSPWRQASSAVMFGSLPSGVYGVGGDNFLTPRPWQTLLFCPNPPSRTTLETLEPDWILGNNLGGKKDHFGFAGPRDHLWLEFFWMPPVEPEGLCDGFSTEGKVNMNYQMLPFTWITRATAMHGALHGVRVTAIPSKAVTTAGTEHYKNPTGPSPLDFRYEVDATKTLDAFKELRFAQGDVFRSASEICDMFLVPKRMANHTYEVGNVTNLPSDPSAYTDMLRWWEGLQAADPTDGFEATGDNLREQPYGQLYPRLCTRSNVFTLHWRVQLLRKSRATKAEIWVDPPPPGSSGDSGSHDYITAEHRGQTTVERYLDSNQRLPTDFATSIDRTEAVDDYYKYRIVNRRAFAP